MGGTLRKFKRGLKKTINKPVEYRTDILVHGRMVYACERCDRRWSMYLEKGIEEPGDDHKPSPFVIQFPFCGGAKRMSEIKLKPCPFCGGEAHIDCFPGLDRPYFPVCNNEMCIACDTIVTFLTEKDAAEAWNRRAGEQNERKQM